MAVARGCFLTADCLYCFPWAEMDTAKFPAGMRVLAVDDDRVSLKILEKQLKHCNYNGECFRLFFLGRHCKFSPSIDRFRRGGSRLGPDDEISEYFFFGILVVWCSGSGDRREAGAGHAQGEEGWGAV